jgi:SAM-dependent methyltransferase
MTMAGCRFCGTVLQHTFVDLGMSPLCESFLTSDLLNQMEPFYPLHAKVCERCFLVQVEEYVDPGHIFSEYAYFSSYSDAWLQHAKAYTDMIVSRLGLHGGSRVVELGSNDGYLLQNFVAKGIPVLGVEPAANVAAAAIAKGVPTTTRLFGPDTAEALVAEGMRADLVIGNNVLAQVSELNGFVAGMQRLLKPGGVITMEFPHLLRLMDENQFDTIYHEHFSYFSFMTAARIFAAHGLTLFDVEELWTHGGSLRIYAQHADGSSRPIEPRVGELLAREKAAGLDRLDRYSDFTRQVEETKRKLLEFLIAAKREGRSIAGYGAPGKGNTLLNYCGIRVDFLDFTVDRNPYKHGRFLPGTHIPVFSPEKLDAEKPDYILILPWNLKDEIMQQLAHAREWGAKFIVPIPEAQIVS